ncbi:Ephrin type-A receptor 6 [Dissostichus eleginoides]|uniref:Ephrin type-A receptor 6 n=1 Tax=Dissostichus eleginoides TaxID=100907 RepID=A0AAD9CJ80_DISEL|nr:Ephrin type-A receptor 6 [Dissostichus eleginoides]
MDAGRMVNSLAVYKLAVDQQRTLRYLGSAMACAPTDVRVLEALRPHRWYPLRATLSTCHSSNGHFTRTNPDPPLKACPPKSGWMGLKFDGLRTWVVKSAP